MPNSARSARSPAFSAVRFDSHPAKMKSGSTARTASDPGAFSDSTGGGGLGRVRWSGRSPSGKAVPTSFSPRPRASTSSVEVDLIVTIRSGAESTVRGNPQLSTGAVNPAGEADGGGVGEAAGDSGEGPAAPGAEAQAARAKADAEATVRVRAKAPENVVRTRHRTSRGDRTRQGNNPGGWRLQSAAVHETVCFGARRP